MRTGTWISATAVSLVFLAVSPAWSQGEPDKKGGESPAASASATEATAPPTPPPAPTPTTTTAAPSPGSPGVLVGTQAPLPPPADAKPKHHKSDRSGDFMDTRLTWTFGDDDVLHATGLAYPLSPHASIGDRPQYRLFFDNLNSRYGGRENITHLVLYKKLPAFFPDLETEAALIMRVDLAQLSTNTGNLNTAFYDAGSYLRLFYFTQHGNKEKNTKDTGVDLTLFPLDTDRFRLGYLYDISWGGTASYINQSIFPRIRGGAPGFKLQYTGDGFSFFGGVKTASITQVTEVLSPGTNEVETIKLAETNYGFLGGGSVDIAEFLRVDVGGGYFQQGTFELPDVFGKRVYTFGGSGRVVVHQNMPVPRSVDFLLYRNDPNNPMIMFAPVKYKEGEFAWSLSAEFDRLEQNLKDFDVSGATKLQHANAGAAQAVVQAGYLRASLTGIYRDLPFVVRNQPGYIPFQTLPADAITDAEKFFAASADYHLAGLKLTPGIGAGVKFPSTFRSESNDMFGNTIGRTVVVREQGNISILPLGKKAVPVVQARLSLRWDISEMMAAVLWGQYVRDNNATFVQRDPSEGTLTLRTFLKPDFIGFGMSVQARF